MAIRFIGDKVFGSFKKNGKLITIDGFNLDELFYKLKINLEAVK